MKYCLYILLFLLSAATTMQAQRPGGSRPGRSSRSTSGLATPRKELPDSLLKADSSALNSARIKAYQLSDRLSTPYLVPMDTNRLNFSNSTLMESKSLAIGYLANIGSPAQTRIFSERPEARDFIFSDPYDYNITTPANARFYDNKVPYTHILYTTGGGSITKEEQLKGTLSINFGKKVNVGGDLDYIYGRGHYNSNGNKLLSYRLFGSFRSDRYELHAYLSNYNFINFENGGLTNDRYITNPDDFTDGTRITDTKAFPVRFTQTWNRVRGKQYYLTHRYNLGFSRTLDETNEDGTVKEQFIPVSSIIHTMEYEDNRRHYLSQDPGIDTCYVANYGNYKIAEDRASAWYLKNTFALSLREGFQDWVKFGLAAFVSFEKRRFKMPAPIPGATYGPEGVSYFQPTTFNFNPNEIFDEFSTYLGAELSKQQGSILTYNARGELCLVGSDLGEFRINANLQTRFPLFKKEATIKAIGYLKNVTPAFFQRHNHSRFFWWDTNLKNTQQFYAGAEINLESTHTTLSAGVESVQNYVYFNQTGLPSQYDGNLQIVSARLKQDFRYKAFGWEGEAIYQLSSNKEILPLPHISIYTNLYCAFKLAKVLTLQIGANMYYNTAYKAPYYEPATQQFQLQDKVDVGNYPLINGYVNFHLKQARFFVMAYNLGSKFVDPEYFSLAHYPLNPMVLKMG
ncbi:MAG: putative porin, partial [Tannerellaceae bacterium]